MLYRSPKRVALHKEWDSFVPKGMKYVVRDGFHIFRDRIYKFFEMQCTMYLLQPNNENSKKVGLAHEILMLLLASEQCLDCAEDAVDLRG